MEVTEVKAGDLIFADVGFGEGGAPPAERFSEFFGDKTFADSGNFFLRNPGRGLTNAFVQIYDLFDADAGLENARRAHGMSPVLRQQVSSNAWRWHEADLYALSSGDGSTTFATVMDQLILILRLFFEQDLNTATNLWDRKRELLSSDPALQSYENLVEDITAHDFADPRLASVLIPLDSATYTGEERKQELRRRFPLPTQRLWGHLLFRAIFPGSLRPSVFFARDLLCRSEYPTVHSVSANGYSASATRGVDMMVAKSGSGGGSGGS